jgi:hypothetical protein
MYWLRMLLMMITIVNLVIFVAALLLNKFMAVNLLAALGCGAVYTGLLYYETR